MATIDPAYFDENARTAPATAERQIACIGDLQLESGTVLPNVEVAYQVFGTLNEDRSNAILVCHALSGDSNCAGWWDRLIGPGKAFDTDKYAVIGTNALGGCQGTTGPSSLSPEGQPWGSSFPAITVGDMVAAQARLLDRLGIPQLACVTGGSMGGMQALEWTRQFPARVARAYITASSTAHTALQIAYNEAARQAILRDPDWAGGDYYPGPGPVHGLAVSRMIGHISFLSELAFTAKFGRDRKSEPDGWAAEFQVESYLNYQGDKFTKRFDANSFLVLSKAIDRYECAELPSGPRMLFTSYSSDLLYPSHQSETAHQLSIAAGRQSAHHVIETPWGHDAFLLEAEEQTRLIRDFLAG